MAVAPSRELSDIVGADHIRSPKPGTFAVDSASPVSIVSPASYDEVAAVLGHANDNELAVIPFGGGTSMHLGNTPSKYDIALDSSRLNTIVEYEPADLTVTCQAGMTLAALQERLLAAGQTLLLGPFSEPTATVGGILASNRLGAYVHRQGRPRDVTIGLRVATADGRIARAGGRVVKNVAGYDMAKLHIGALGTLGAIVEATFKVAPLPVTESRLSFVMQDVGIAYRLASDVERRALSVRAIEVCLHADECVVTLDLAGSPHAVERSAVEASQQASSLGGTSTGPADFPASIDSLFVTRFETLPSTIPTLVSQLGAVNPQARIVTWPTAGILFAGWDDADELAVLHQIKSRQGGETMTIERCTTDLKRRIDVFGPPPPSSPLMRAIKQQFDPNGILSPGRFVGRL